MITRFRIRGETGAVVDCTFLVHLDGAITVEFDDGLDEMETPAPKPKTAPRLVIGRVAEQVVIEEDEYADGEPEAPKTEARPVEDVEPEPTPDDDDPFDLADKPTTDEAVAPSDDPAPPPIVRDRGKRWTAAACREMEDALPVELRTRARDEANVTPYNQGQVHSRWGNDALDALHDALSRAVQDDAIEEPAAEEPRPTDSEEPEPSTSHDEAPV